MRFALIASALVCLATPALADDLSSVSPNGNAALDSLAGQLAATGRARALADGRIATLQQQLEAMQTQMIKLRQDMATSMQKQCGAPSAAPEGPVHPPPT